MENKAQPKGNTPMPDSPKPTDEVQMNIETVTPETEKNVVPTEEAGEKQPQSAEVDKEVKIENKEEEQEHEEPVTTEEDEPTTEEEVPAEDSDSEEKVDEGEHPGDDIETVSP